jgi:hypothetical protein
MAGNCDECGADLAAAKAMHERDVYRKALEDIRVILTLPSRAQEGRFKRAHQVIDAAIAKAKGVRE